MNMSRRRYLENLRVGTPLILENWEDSGIWTILWLRSAFPSYYFNKFEIFSTFDMFLSSPSFIHSECLILSLLSTSLSSFILSSRSLWIYYFSPLILLLSRSLCPLITLFFEPCHLCLFFLYAFSFFSRSSCFFIDWFSLPFLRSITDKFVLI